MSIASHNLEKRYTSPIGRMVEMHVRQLDSNIYGSFFISTPENTLE